MAKKSDTITYKILETEFEETRQIIADKMPAVITDNAHIGQYILVFAYEELNAEEHYINQKEIDDFGIVKYQEVYLGDHYVKVTAQAKQTGIDVLMTRLKYIYPNVYNDKNKNNFDFIAHLGFVFAKRIQNGQVIPKLAQKVKG
ncbi:hypothetical protein OZX69_09680 (plasmid) [Lactobacillus sp. ESL0731]|uniref:hypothetical protein n=1 Tax=unclassified Lactobacillus TaxID=2620435 RepID=UPI0023F67F85|nr:MULTISPECIES: hypothetical protein [unclassified Lactobacillus]WEV52087.1 hypothetical protein OZX63_09645 [Lactobacillus sp. ESL0700]WEV63222.1 hypothetical protein OZX69_09680 [Lactobacillus sp. ESL0731]